MLLCSENGYHASTWLLKMSSFLSRCSWKYSWISGPSFLPLVFSTNIFTIPCDKGMKNDEDERCCFEMDMRDSIVWKKTDRQHSSIIFPWLMKLHCPVFDQSRQLQSGSQTPGLSSLILLNFILLFLSSSVFCTICSPCLHSRVISNSRKWQEIFLVFFFSWNVSSCLCWVENNKRLCEPFLDIIMENFSSGSDDAPFHIHFLASLSFLQNCDWSKLPDSKPSIKTLERQDEETSKSGSEDTDLKMYLFFMLRIFLLPMMLPFPRNYYCSHFSSASPIWY